MVQATRNKPLVPSFGVKLNGVPLVAGMAMWIVNVSVEDELDLPGMFTLELISQQNKTGTTAWTDDLRLSIGVEVEISMGYGDNRESLILGEITALEPTFSISGPPTLLVRGFDRRHRLNKVRRTRSFVAQKDSDIAAQVGSDAGVSVEATDSVVTHSYVLQANQTDLEFLQERARRMRYELAMDRDVLLYRPVANAGSTAVSLTLNDDLFEFRPRMSLVPLTSVTVQGWDPKAKQAITSSAQVTDEVSTMEGRQSAAGLAEDLFVTEVEAVVRAPVMSQAEADQMAKAKFNDAALDFIRGEGRVRGRTDVRAGSVIEISDIGTRFSGQYYVTAVVHRYTRRDGYLTDFRVQRNAS
jgi:phage protein D